jgi:PTH1 family peptidyl-tRNA hydrolase
MGRTARHREGAARAEHAFPKAEPTREIVINSLEDSVQHIDINPRTRRTATPTLPHTIETITADAQMPRPLLIIAIGNKGGQYRDTYHNAGVTLLHALRRLELPAHWELAESTHFMNESGNFVKKRLAKWAGARAAGRLVVLQDEMERDVGRLAVRAGASSARGHNGIKSIQQRLPRDMEWFRVAVGVGRPTSRDPVQVANYVLAKMKPQEVEAITDKAQEVMEELSKISEADR